MEKTLFTKKSLARLIAPLIVEQLLAVTIGLADTLMVANVGEFAVSAISLVDQINILLIQVFLALATGGAVVASQYIGAGDFRGACDTAKQLTYTVTSLAVVIGLAAGTCAGPALQMIYGRLDESVMSAARIYLILSAASYPFLALYDAGAAIFRAMGKSRVSMLVSMVMNITNVAGNALLIYGFNMGVTGAAIASLASRALGAIVVTALTTRANGTMFVNRLFKFEFRGGIVRRILRVGVPNGLECGAFQVGKLIVARVISGLGTSVIAANALSNSVAGFVCVPGDAIGLAMITVVGQCVGAGRIDEAKRNIRRLMIASFGLMAAMDVCMYVAVGPMMNMFSLGAEARELATEVCRVYAVVSAVLWPISFSFPNALRASGDAKFTMWASMVSMLVFRVGLSFLFVVGFGWGLMGVWGAMYVDWGVRCACFAWRYASGRWVGKSVV